MSDISFTTQSLKHIKQNSFITFQQNLLILNYVNYICYLSHYLFFFTDIYLRQKRYFSQLKLGFRLVQWNSSSTTFLFSFLQINV